MSMHTFDRHSLEESPMKMNQREGIYSNALYAGVKKTEEQAGEMMLHNRSRTAFTSQAMRNTRSGKLVQIFRSTKPIMIS